MEKESAIAINKFFFFSTNYRSVIHKWETTYGEEREDVVPEFLVKVKWTCGFEHIFGKWKSIEDKDCFGLINRFYAGLDSANRVRMIEWVMDNFNGEQKLRFNEE